MAVADMGAYETPDPVQLLDRLIDVVTASGASAIESSDCLLEKLKAARKALENRSETTTLRLRPS